MTAPSLRHVTAVLAGLALAATLTVASAGPCCDSDDDDDDHQPTPEATAAPGPTVEPASAPTPEPTPAPTPDPAPQDDDPSENVRLAPPAVHTGGCLFGPPFCNNPVPARATPPAPPVGAPQLTPCQNVIGAWAQGRLSVAQVLSICNGQPMPQEPRFPPTLRLPNAGS